MFGYATSTLYAISFLICFLLTLFLVPLAMKIATRYSILDEPNQNHKTHKSPIPYLGGMTIIFPVTIVSLSGITLFSQNSEVVYRTLILIVPSILLGIVGLLDDILNLSHKSRLFIQFFTSVCASVFLVISDFSIKLFNSDLINVLLSVIWIVGITNAWNFVDNLDGAAACLTIICALSLGLLSIQSGQFLIASFALAIAGSAIGFLPWNFFPAKIYLGDSGALYLGVTISILLLQFESTLGDRFISSLTVIFLAAVPLIDATVAVTGRIKRHASIFQGGKDHLSHRLINKGINKKKTLAILCGVSMFYSLLAVLLQRAEGWIVTLGGLIGVSSIFCIILLFIKLPPPGDH